MSAAFASRSHCSSLRRSVRANGGSFAAHRMSLAYARPMPATRRPSRMAVDKRPGRCRETFPPLCRGKSDGLRSQMCQVANFVDLVGGDDGQAGAVFGGRLAQPEFAAVVERQDDGDDLSGTAQRWCGKPDPSGLHEVNHGAQTVTVDADQLAPTPDAGDRSIHEVIEARCDRSDDRRVKRMCRNDASSNTNCVQTLDNCLDFRKLRHGRENPRSLYSPRCPFPPRENSDPT